MNTITTGELGALVDEHKEGVMKFLAGVLCHPHIFVLEICLERLGQGVVEVPRGITARAALLQHAHATTERFSHEPNAPGPHLWTQVAMGCWINDSELNRRLLESNVMSRLSKRDRCAIMLVRLRLELAERQHILERQFSIDPADCVATERQALEEYKTQYWALEHAAALEDHLRPLGSVLHARGSEFSDVVPLLVVLAATFLFATRDGRPPLHQRLTQVIKFMRESGELEPGPRLMQIDDARALSMFNILVRNHGLTWDSVDIDKSLHHLTMLTYHHADEHEVRRLHTELNQSRAPLAKSSLVWVDWLGVKKGQDPFILVAAVILLLAQGYVVSVGPAGLGPVQRWELQAAECVHRWDPEHRRIVVAYLETRTNTNPTPTVTPDVPHIQVDLQSDRASGIKRIWEHLAS